MNQQWTDFSGLVRIIDKGDLSSCFPMNSHNSNYTCRLVYIFRNELHVGDFELLADGTTQAWQEVEMGNVLIIKGITI